MKTKEKIYNQYFLNIRDIQILFELSRPKARQVFEYADELDHEKYKEYRVENKKVSIDSICKVLKVSDKDIKKRIVGLERF